MIEDGEATAPATLIDINSISVEILQAVIKNQQRKAQTASKVFVDHYDISELHLKRLIQLIEDELTIIKKLNISCQSTLLLSDGRKHDFSTWSELEEFDRSSNKKTRSISFDLTISAINNDTGGLERFRIQISVQNNPASFGIQLGGVGLVPIDSFGLPPAPIAVQVEYSNYIIGKNIISTIENWEKSLPKARKKILKFMQRHSGKLPRIFSTASVLSGSFVIAAFAPIFFQGRDLDVSEIVAAVTLTIAILYVFFEFGRSLGRYAERAIDSVDYGNNIFFTEGDSLSRRSLSSNNKNKYVSAGFSLFIILLQIFISIFSTDLRNYLLN